jgi:hypothetical protein
MKNVSTFDAKVRYLFGGLFLGLGAVLFFFELPFVVGSLITGGALIVTARMRFCGLYKLIGFNSCPLEER